MQSGPDELHAQRDRARLLDSNVTAPYHPPRRNRGHGVSCVRRRHRRL